MPFSDSVGFFALWPSMWPLISQVDKKKSDWYFPLFKAKLKIYWFLNTEHIEPSLACCKFSVKPKKALTVLYLLSSAWLLSEW